jgi:hypothetical protein
LLALIFGSSELAFELASDAWRPTLAALFIWLCCGVCALAVVAAQTMAAKATLPTSNLIVLPHTFHARS